VTIGACLIVRDAADSLSACLPPLLAALDEVVVFDIGSTDETAALAVELGARVYLGTWQHDFARARNRALTAMSARWVLSVDADEVAEIDRAGLDTYLEQCERDGSVIAAVQRTNHYANQTSTRFHTPRLFRRGSAQWQGRAHEILVTTDPTATSIARCSPTLVRLEHSGYAEATGARVRAERNVRLAYAEVDHLAADPTTTRERLACAQLNLGRSLIAIDEPAAAVRVLDALRASAGEDAEGVAIRARSTDYLARIFLADGGFDTARMLIAELLAQALAQTGEAERAAQLLAPITTLVDPSGHEVDANLLQEFRTLTRALTVALSA
jgi:hypothetical protein